MRAYLGSSRYVASMGGERGKMWMMHAHEDSDRAEVRPAGSALDGAPRVVIVGGFLTSPLLYRPFRQRLLARGAAEVRICPLWTPEWLLAAAGVGFGPLMRRTGTAIARAYRDGGGRPVLVVGHSAGGILARLAMSPRPFEGRLASVGPAVGALVTLGTPHQMRQSARLAVHVGWRAQRFLEASMTGTYLSPRTGYLAVSSRAVRGAIAGERDPRRFLAGWSYAIQAGASARLGVGDGLVPEVATHLDGARHITLGNALHGPMWGEAWYGEDEALDAWWPAAMEVWRGALAARRGDPSTRAGSGVTGDAASA
jgi:hypothetical protein